MTSIMNVFFQVWRARHQCACHYNQCLNELFLVLNQRKLFLAQAPLVKTKLSLLLVCLFIVVCCCCCCCCFFWIFFLIRSHSLSGADVIDTLPSLHPLVCLHSNVRQKAMDEFLQNMMEIPTSDTSDVTNSVMTDLKTSPKNTIRSLSQSHISV